MKKKKIRTVILLLILLGLMLISCRRKETEGKNSYNIHYVNQDATAVLYYEYMTQSTEKRDVLQELIGELGRIPKKLEYQ